MTLRTGSVNTSTVGGLDAYALATMATQQAANIGANDHIKFDTVAVSEGTEVVVDTTTAYSNAQGAASIGRVTLHGTPNGGLAYHLSFNLGAAVFSGATGSLALQFFDATNNVALAGSTVLSKAQTDAGNDASTGAMEAVVVPTSDILVEVRITAVTALTQIGVTGSSFPSLFVQTL